MPPRKKNLEGELLRWLQNPANWRGQTKNWADCDPNVKRARKDTLKEAVERLGGGATVDSEEELHKGVFSASQIVFLYCLVFSKLLD